MGGGGPLRGLSSLSDMLLRGFGGRDRRWVRLCRENWGSGDELLKGQSEALPSVGHRQSGLESALQVMWPDELMSTNDVG